MHANNICNVARQQAISLDQTSVLVCVFFYLFSFVFHSIGDLAFHATWCASRDNFRSINIDVHELRLSLLHVHYSEDRLNMSIIFAHISVSELKSALFSARTCSMSSAVCVCLIDWSIDMQGLQQIPSHDALLMEKDMWVSDYKQHFAMMMVSYKVKAI